MPTKASDPDPVIVWQRNYHTDTTGEALMHWSAADSAGTWHDVLAPLELLYKRTDLRSVLVNHMAALPTDGAQALAIIDEAIRHGRKTADIGTLTERTGWFINADKLTFVFRERTLGDQNVIHRSRLTSRPSGLAVKGSLKPWRKGLKKPCQSSPYLIFGLALAFAGPTLRFYPSGTGLLFNLAGESGGGKTTILKAAISTMAAPTNKEMVSASLSPAALEQTSFELNDLVLCVDEFGAALGSPKQAASLIHNLAYQTREGRGKKRSTAGQRSLGFEHATWFISVLTSSENTLDSMMGDEKRETGAQIRYVDLLVPSTADGGAFPSLPVGKHKNALSGADLVRKVENAISANYGLALPAFVEGLIAEPGLEAKLLVYRDEFVAQLRLRSSGQQSRYLESFAMVLAAGRLAVEYKVAPFSLDLLFNAVNQLFNQSALVRGERDGQFSHAVATMVSLGEDTARCPRHEKGKRLGNADGSIIAVRFNRAGEVIFVPVVNLGKLLPAGCAENAVLTYLQSVGVLRGRDVARTQQAQIPGLVAGNDRPSGYMLDWAKLRELAISKTTKTSGE
jgi:hypothetical protein